MGLSIVKELTGEVTIYDSVNGNPIKQFTEDAALFLTWKKRQGGVFVADSVGQEFNIDLAQLVDTQVLPAAAVQFTSDARTLYELLERDFFYNVVNSANSIPGTVKGVTSTAVNYAILASDETIICTANVTLTLPTAPTIGQEFKISANNNTVTVNPAPGDLIAGKASLILKRYNSIIVEYDYANNWLIY